MKLTPEEKKQREIAKWEKEKAKDKTLNCTPFVRQV